MCLIYLHACGVGFLNLHQQSPAAYPTFRIIEKMATERIENRAEDLDLNPTFGQRGFGQRYPDMLPSFPFLLTPNTHQCTDRYSCLYPLQTTLASNPFLASSGTAFPLTKFPPTKLTSKADYKQKVNKM